MKAITKMKYGGPEVLRYEDVEIPSIEAGQILIKVYANSANPADWHIMRGKPFFARLTFGLFKPKEKILGVDFAGVVEQVGASVTNFKVGDCVFGESLACGAFAEYIRMDEKKCAKIPEGQSFSEFACLPVAGLTAFHALVTYGKIEKGETVLINGASGGVGHFAVQIAKEYGAIVTAVCSSNKEEFVKKLGADYVIAYDKENIHSHTGKYNLVIDTHGNLDFQDFKRMGHRGILTGFTSMGHMFSILLRKMISKFPLIQFTVDAKPNDLEKLAILLKENRIKVYIEKTFTAEKIPDAIRYIESMRTQGKVAMIWRKEDGI